MYGRKSEDALHELEIDIKRRAKALSKQGEGAMEYGSREIIERNKSAASYYFSDIAKEKRRRERGLKKEKQEKNLILVKKEQDRKHR